MKAKIKTSKYLTKIFETKSDGSSEWFGYYNYDTLNYNQTKMLCNRSKIDGVAPAKGMSIELGYYDIPSGVWHHIGESDSWNWQQGAMMQWLPGKGNENKVIYNTSNNDRLISIIHDINTGADKQIDWAIYGITPDGKKSIALDLERSYWCRAYHYSSVANKEKDGRIYDGDGIFEVDLVSNTRKRIISIQDIIKIDYRPYFDMQKHWVEHIMINPAGTRFCFLHRFSPENDVFKYQTRLMIADIDGSNLQCIKGWDKSLWSHFGWCGDNSFCIYTREFNSTNVPSLGQCIKHPWNVKNLIKRVWISCVSRMPYKIRKKFLGHHTYYQFYSIGKGESFSLLRKFDNPIFQIDGHPSFTNDKQYMITDTYADEKCKQKLLIYNIINGCGVNASVLYNLYKGNPASCDLHPKLCRNNEYLVVDTAYDLNHHMIVFKINWDFVKSKIG